MVSVVSGGASVLLHGCSQDNLQSGRPGLGSPKLLRQPGRGGSEQWGGRDHRQLLAEMPPHPHPPGNGRGPGELIWLLIQPSKKRGEPLLMSQNCILLTGCSGSDREGVQALRPGPSSSLFTPPASWGLEGEPGARPTWSGWPAGMSGCSAHLGPAVGHRLLRDSSEEAGLPQLAGAGPGDGG